MEFEKIFNFISRNNVGNEKEVSPESARRMRTVLVSNGYVFDARKKRWKFSPLYGEGSLNLSFQEQDIAFFGPSSHEGFFRYQNLPTEYYERTFTDHAIETLEKIEDRGNGAYVFAKEVAFYMGSFVRDALKVDTSEEGFQEARERIEYISRMTRLGEVRSSTAIASAITRYILSGGELDSSPEFAGNIYHMGEAVEEDAIRPWNTSELGLSQVNRLGRFLAKKGENEKNPLVNENDDVVKTIKSEVFKDFPTVGAEFHLPISLVTQDLLQRVAILNMSQYQHRSHVQFSRNDRGVFEIRMNPSIFPVTISNWKYIRQIIPEIEDSFFTLTLNRNARDFVWGNDNKLIRNLSILGSLTYATMFESVPADRKGEEIDFGSQYLGQTVKVENGLTKFTGFWGSSRGRDGQLGLYVGFGDSLPDLAYNLSMGLANEELLGDTISNLENPYVLGHLENALSLNASQRIAFFEHFMDRVGKSSKLKEASELGWQIEDKLSPSEPRQL